ncbi:MAG: YceD family protein [Acidimicrobiales bacterium]
MGSKDFSLSVFKLLRESGTPVSFHREGTSSEIFIRFSRVESDQMIEIDGVLESVHPGVLVSGTICSVSHGECARCLDDAFNVITAEVRELFEVDATEESGSYSFDGEVIDLTEMIKDALVLQLPLVPLCSPDCPGLCPTCGSSLKEGPCGCDRSPRDERWAALDELDDAVQRKGE